MQIWKVAFKTAVYVQCTCVYEHKLRETAEIN